MNAPSIKISIYKLLILVLPVLTVWYVSNYFDSKKPECTQSDIYNIWEYSQCTPEWKMTRTITQKSDYSCKNPWKVVKPEESMSCEYVPQCTEANWNIWDWGICSASWSHDRIIEKIGRCDWGYVPSSTWVCSTKTTYLFKKWVKEHTTIIEEEWKYSNKNHNNLEILPTGKFKSITLKIVGDTSPVKIDEYYYVFYWLNNGYASPRVIWTSRIQLNRFDLKDYWVFQWFNAPKKIEVDLKNLKLANEWGNKWSTVDSKSFDLINNSSWKILNMTLFLADGQSMTTLDRNKRIFWTITDAWFEYECEETERCSIERVPNIN